MLNSLSFYFSSIINFLTIFNRIIYNLVAGYYNYYYSILIYLFNFKIFSSRRYYYFNYNLFKIILLKRDSDGRFELICFILFCSGLIFFLADFIPSLISFVQTNTLFEILIIILNLLVSVFKPIIYFFISVLLYIFYFTIIATIISLYFSWLWLLIQGEFSDNQTIFKLQGYALIALIIFCLITVLNITYMTLSFYFDFYLHDIIITNLLLFYSNFNIILYSLNIQLESIGIYWFSGFSDNSGLNTEFNSFNLNELFPINSSRDIKPGTTADLPAVASSGSADLGSSPNIIINPNTHVASVTASGDKLTLAVTVNSATVTDGLKNIGQSTFDAAKDIVQNPGPSLTTGVGLSAGVKAGMEVAKSIQSPVGKVAAIATSTILTTGIGLAAVHAAQSYAADRARDSVFNQPTVDNRAPSPSNDPSSATTFSPFDSAEGWTWSFTINTDGTTSPLQYLFHSLILFQVIMLLIFVYLSVLVIMQIIVNKHSNTIIAFVNRLPLPAWLNSFLVKYLNIQFNLHRTIYKFIIGFNILLFLFSSICSILIVSQLNVNLDYYCTDHLNFHSLNTFNPK